VSVFQPALATACVLALATSAHAAFSPDLRHIQPRGGQRGGEVELTLHGQRLDAPRELLFHQPGLEVLSLAANDKGNQVTARIRIAPDAALGEHVMRLRTDGGVSYLRSFWVGPFPTLEETEPNDAFDQAQPVALGHTVHGVARNEDEDLFKVTLKKGQQLSVELEAMRLGRRFFDGYVAILDPQRFELAACDDSALLYTDAFASIVAPADGDYRVVVREAAYEGRDDMQYRLHIGSFPRPAAIFPPAARPGEELEFRFLGDPAGELTRRVAIDPQAAGPTPVFPVRDGAIAPSPHWVRVSPEAYVNEDEPNDGSKEANPMPPLPAAAHGILSKSKDVDWFRFDATKGERLEIRLHGRSLRSPLDSVLILRDAKGKQLATNDDLGRGDIDSRINWNCPADGHYFVNVRDQLARSGDDYTYRLEITRQQPRVAASLPQAARNDSQARKMICVPRGNRYATVVNLSRDNYRGGLAFAADSLPAGLTLDAPEADRSTNSIPVLFEAADDAPIAGGYHRFSVRAHGEDAPELSGPLRESIHHIEVNNQGSYHSTDSEKIAVAVIEEAPLHLELEAPATPIVHHGTLQLRVRVRRAEGFDGPVTLSLPWKPAGIGSPNTVTLPKGRDQIDYEINANGDAALGTWPILVLAEAKTDRGPVLVSSGFRKLEVAEPRVAATIDLGATRQGEDTVVVAQLEHLAEFKGEARAELIGLPHGTSTGSLRFRHGQPRLEFPLEVADDAATGKHSGLFLHLHLPHHGNEILHKTGRGGTLRIDKARQNQPAANKGKPSRPDKKPEKPLSRLEQLRRQAAAE